MNQEKLTNLSELLTSKDFFVPVAYHENMKNTILGDYGEKYICNLLINSGYFVQICASERNCGDLRILDTQTGEKLQGEVKTAYESARGQYGFCLRKQNHTDISYSDFVILLCIDKYNSHYQYVIPSGLIGSKFLSITSHPVKYKGKYSPFLVRGAINFQNTHEVAQLW